jgi:hypothetical protein
MKTLLRIILTALLLTPLAALHGAVYHVSPAGDDANPGATPAEAWKTVDRVNRQAFQPGDSILFQSGGVWQGQLRLQGSGTEGKPIRLDRYGEGPLPVINAGGAQGAVLALVDQGGWEIRHLDLRGGGESAGPGERGGIWVEGRKADRVLRHIHITDCRVLDFRGDLGYRSCGIWVAMPAWNDNKGAPARLCVDDVLIANNEIRNGSRAGIILLSAGTSPAWRPQGAPNTEPTVKWTGRPPARNIIVRSNTLEDLTGDAIMVIGADKPLVEGNVARRTCLRTGAPELRPHKGYNPHSAAIWLQNCTGGVMQRNEVTHTGRQTDNNDGMSFDFDFNCFDCVVQYNVSRENQGGLLLIMPTARNNVVRYNLSLNDRTHLLFMQGSYAENNLVHNNVFAVDTPVYFTPGGKLWNNIFYATGHGALFWTGEPQPDQFRGNCFFGRWESVSPWRNQRPTDPGMIEADPQFVAPGAGGDGLDSWRGYQLKPTSPCRNAGVPVPNNGGRDLWGNPLRNGKPDIGAHESQPPTKGTP